MPTLESVSLLVIKTDILRETLSGGNGSSIKSVKPIEVFELRDYHWFAIKTILAFKNKSRACAIYKPIDYGTLSVFLYKSPHPNNYAIPNKKQPKIIHSYYF